MSDPIKRNIFHILKFGCSVRSLEEVGLGAVSLQLAQRISPVPPLPPSAPRVLSQTAPAGRRRGTCHVPRASAPADASCPVWAAGDTAPLPCPRRSGRQAGWRPGAPERRQGTTAVGRRQRAASSNLGRGAGNWSSCPACHEMLAAVSLYEVLSPPRSSSGST